VYSSFHIIKILKTGIGEKWQESMSVEQRDIQLWDIVYSWTFLHKFIWVRRFISVC
jgi:hypothetical protein